MSTRRESVGGRCRTCYGNIRQDGLFARKDISCIRAGGRYAWGAGEWGLYFLRALQVEPRGVARAWETPCANPGTFYCGESAALSYHAEPSSYRYHRYEAGLCKRQQKSCPDISSKPVPNFLRFRFSATQPTD